MPSGGRRDGSGRKPQELKCIKVGGYCQSQLNIALKEELERRISEISLPIKHIRDKQKSMSLKERREYSDSDELEDDRFEIEEHLIKLHRLEKEYKKYLDGDSSEAYLQSRFEDLRVFSIDKPKENSRIAHRLKRQIIKEASEKFELKEDTVRVYWNQFNRDFSD